MTGAKRRTEAAPAARAAPGSRVAPARRPSRRAAERSAIPIVAVGASAGGLEALEVLFAHMPVDSGIAFVVVVHQHPGHKSLLGELLGRATKIPVIEVKKRTRLRPNRIYLGPPGSLLSVSDGALLPRDAAAQPSPPHSVDSLFRSLAEDQKERAICIVLSGTGTDGTLGMKAIKAESGMAIVQRSSTAKYAGMPSSALATGLAHYELAPAEIPESLIAYASGPYRRSHRVPDEASPGLSPALQRILLLLRTRSGHDFSAYKASTLRRRVERRMNVHQITKPDLYLRFVDENPFEIDILFKELLISVTSFFRDPEAFEALAAGPLPELLRTRTAEGPVRVWVPGCASGEEVFSIAILLVECIEQLDAPVDVQIFGTDLDAAAIALARSARYPEGIARDVSAARLRRHFVKENGTYRVRKETRELAVFAPQNVIRDPPFTRPDLLVCRNLLIYLKTDLQRRLLPLFHYALNPAGLLLLGPSESVGPHTDLLETLDKRWRIFRRKGAARPSVIPEIPAVRHSGLLLGAARHAAPTTREAALAGIMERLLLSRFAPPSVVINERGDIVHIHGRTGDFLEPVDGQPRMNVLEMAREGLRVELASALRQAITQRKEVVRERLRVRVNGEVRLIDLSVVKITEPESIRGLLLVAFNATPEPAPAAGAKAGGKIRGAAAGRIAALEMDLQHARESLHTTVEELETSNEELKSTNEELQSTNEELETSREEMQSLNEELTTVNAELHTEVEELSRTNDDMHNLLNSTGIATLFLDGRLNIKRYTEKARGLIRLIPTDIGRPLADLITSVKYPHMAEDCRDVLATLASRQVEVETEDGTRHLMRIMPYRTADNAIDGLVITFVDLSQLA